MNRREKKILIVEDDQGIRELTSLYLEKKGYKVVTADTGFEALELVNSEEPNLVLLDILLPGITGFDVCVKIRETSTVPVLFMSCKRDSEDKVQGFNAGADDYITKPFDLVELEARIQAILRRSGQAPKVHQTTLRFLSVDQLSIDLKNFDVYVRKELVDLYTKEKQLLLILVKNPNQVFSAEQLYKQIWGMESYGDLKTVMVHISNLRRKIEVDPGKPKYIQTVRGFGYKFASEKTISSF
ncbi:DNA-binding response regulator [Salipaludibacillus neizhouensis]|uniref:DNA-binding response regulator n=1 Tax=Salipaludibacillus neizhouensis TaxID=885475 RepID=A0A3A9K8H8_9BACI|nr:response regulator transcription factor [Salipaludibacillus neizhouensis]RKL67130.1 DNA-binding response regulator [Salipaludibacillus neizhouensis]